MSKWSQVAAVVCGVGVMTVASASVVMAAADPVAKTKRGARTAEGSFQTAKDLMTAFGQLETLRAGFEEEKRITLLVAPLKSRGMLYYERPARLARHTVSPAPSVLVIQGERVQFGDAHSSGTIDLGKRPMVRQFVASFLQLLQGDKGSMLANYAIAFSRAPKQVAGPAYGGWHLALKPRRAPLNRVFRSITIEGHGLSLRKMTIAELSGDVSITTFAEPAINRPFTDSERRRLFSVPPPPGSAP